MILGLFTLNVALVTLGACGTVSMFTIATFSLGFAVSMIMVAVVVTVIELLPFHLHLAFLVVHDVIKTFSVYFGFMMRFLFPTSWRVFVVICWILNLIPLSLIYHLPPSPRQKVNREFKRAVVSLSRLGIQVPESEAVLDQRDRAPSFSSIFDYRSHRRILAIVLLLCSLDAIVSLTNTPTAGQVWKLVRDEKVRYVIQATLSLGSLPVLFYIARRNLSVRMSILFIGWVSTSMYFIGQVPFGSGPFLLMNICGVMLVPLVRTLRTLVLLLFLQLLPTCYRCTSLGVHWSVQLAFVRLGLVIADDIPPTPTHNYTLLLFGVFYLAFVYLASFLPSPRPQNLMNSLQEFNETLSKSSNPENEGDPLPWFTSRPLLHSEKESVSEDVHSLHRMGINKHVLYWASSLWIRSLSSYEHLWGNVSAPGSDSTYLGPPTFPPGQTMSIHNIS
eukprot:sb/3464685/